VKRIAAFVELAALVTVAVADTLVIADRESFEFEGVLNIRPSKQLSHEDVRGKRSPSDNSDVASRKETTRAGSQISGALRLDRSYQIVQLGFF
jgi:hypothetical protein